MRHFHMRQSLDGGPSMSLMADTHIECLWDALRDLSESMPLLGWQINYLEMRFESLTLDMSFPDECDGGSHSLIMTVLPCVCENGRIEILSNLAPLN